MRIEADAAPKAGAERRRHQDSRHRRSALSFSLRPLATRTGVTSGAVRDRAVAVAVQERPTILAPGTSSPDSAKTSAFGFLAWKRTTCACTSPIDPWMSCEDSRLLGVH